MAKMRAVDAAVLVLEKEGIDTAFVVPTLPDDAPMIVREGIARHRCPLQKGEPGQSPA